MPSDGENAETLRDAYRQVWNETNGLMRVAVLLTLPIGYLIVDMIESSSEPCPGCGIELYGQGHNCPKCGYAFTTRGEIRALREEITDDE